MKPLREELEELAKKYDSNALYWRNCEAAARQNVEDSANTAADMEQRAKQIRELLASVPA